MIDSGLKSVDATVGCLFKDRDGNRVPTSDFAQSLEFSYKEVQGVTVSVSPSASAVNLADDREFDVLYYVRADDSSKTLQAALNLQVIVTVENAGEEPKVVKVVVSEVLSAGFLALNDCSVDTCITLDLKTNLSWASYQESVFTWNNAETRCDVFESPDNIPGRWRLPKPEELVAVLRNGLVRENSDAAKYQKNRGNDFYLWTSEVESNDPNQAVAIQFSSEGRDNFSKDQALGVICVR